MADSRSKKSITLSGDGSLGSSIATGGNIANMRYQNQQALPTEGESKSKMFSEISKNFSRPGDRPRGLLNNAASGLAEGFADGARLRDVKEKKENYDKHDQALDYLQRANNSMVERNEWHEERAMEMEQIKPFATAGLEISYSGMDYQTGNDRMRNVMEQAKLSNPSIKGDYVGYVPNTPIVNMRDKDGNITAFSLSSVTGEDVVKRVQGNYIDQQKANTERDFAPIKYAAMEGRTNAAEARVREMNQRTYQAAHQKYAPKIEASSRVKVISGKIRNLIAENPGVYQSVLQAVYNSNEEVPSALQLIAQKFANGKKADAIMKLGKYTKELKVSAVKGLSNPNMAMDKLVAGTIVGSSFSDQAANDILDDLSSKADYEMELNKEYLNEIKGIDGKSLGGGDKYAGMAEDYINKQTGTPQPPPGDPVTIVNPETGEEKTIAENYLDSAIAGGWQTKEQ